MSEFFDLKTPEEFWKLLKSEAKIFPCEREKVPFYRSLHRVLARDVSAPEDLPPFNRSTVDGFAVKASDTAGVSETFPAYLRIAGEVKMGLKAGKELKRGQAVKIPTGGMLPPGADAVVMIEYTDFLDENTVEISRPVASGENVVRQGEDIQKGRLLLKKGHLIRPQDIGAFAGLGITEVEVFRVPEVAIISTGDELVFPEEQPEPGQVRDINSYSIGALLEEMGIKVRRAGIIKDSFSQLKKALQNNLDCDLILVSGGSSVGVKDLSIEVFNSLGKPGVLLHGLSVKPGKPTILAVVDGKPILGLPGHPSSAWTVTTVLVKPLVECLQGRRDPDEIERVFSRDNYSNAQTVKARLNRNVSSGKGRKEFIPVRLIRDNSKLSDVEYLAEPVMGKSSLITTLVEADGYIIIESNLEGLTGGEKVTVFLF